MERRHLGKFSGRQPEDKVPPGRLRSHGKNRGRKIIKKKRGSHHVMLRNEKAEA